jgi:hypothetical protein
MITGRQCRPLSSARSLIDVRPRTREQTAGLTIIDRKVTDMARETGFYLQNLLFGAAVFAVVGIVALFTVPPVYGLAVLAVAALFVGAHFALRGRM